MSTAATKASAPLHGPATGALRHAVSQLPLVRWLRLWARFHFGLRRTLTRQLSWRSTPSASARSARRLRVLVPVIETSHYQHFQVLIVAKALQLRGADVKVVVCGEALDGCEIKTVRNAGTADRCLSCRFHERSTLPLFGLESMRLADLVPAERRAALREEAWQRVRLGRDHLRRDGIDLAQTVEDSATRYFYGAIPPDAALVERVRAEHLSTALLNLEVAQQLAATWQPDVIFTHMISYGEWEPYFKYFRARGTQFSAISLSQFDFSRVVVSGFELFQSTERYRQFVANRAGQLLSAAERQQLEHFVGRRKQGSADIFRQDSYFAASAAQEVKARIGFDPEKRNIFLFSNLYWDVGLSNQAALFEDVLAWVLKTVELLAGHPQCHLYIKPHPAEVFGSAASMKGVAQIVRERFPELPANVTIIEPEWRLNTYELFALIDLGVIFTGTLGLEMMLAGIPVVSTGATSHKGLGFAAEPTSIEEYRAILLGTAPPPQIDRQQLELFAYFYFIRTLLPWKLTPQAYADDFGGFTIDSLEDLAPGRDPQLDHLCNCILERDSTVIEAWPDALPAPGPIGHHSTRT
jgi:hypothetical protein